MELLVKVLGLLFFLLAVVAWTIIFSASAIGDDEARRAALRAIREHQEETLEE